MSYEEARELRVLRDEQRRLAALTDGGWVPYAAMARWRRRFWLLWACLAAAVWLVVVLARG